MRRMRGEVSAVVYDFAGQRRLRYDAGTTYTSILAGIAAPVRAALTENPDAEVSVRGFQLAPGGAEIVGQRARRSDLAALALSNPTASSMGHLLQAVRDDELKASNLALFGRSVYSGAEWRGSLTPSATFEVNGTYEPAAVKLEHIATSATVEQVLSAYCLLTDFESSGSKIARAALSPPSDQTGLARNIISAGILCGLSAYTGPFREEVLLSLGDWNGWGIAVRYHSDAAITPRVDTAANRMFAQIGWNVYCYFDTVTAAQNVDTRLPWFLRRGVTRWADSITGATAPPSASEAR